MVLRQQALIVLSFLICFLWTERLSAAIEKIPATGDTIEANAYNRLAYKLRLSDNVEAKKAGRKALEISRYLEYKEGIITAYLTLSEVYLDIAQTDSSYFLTNEAVNMAKELGKPVYLSRSYNRLGVFYDRISDYTNSLKYQVKAIAIAEKIQDYEILSNAYNNIGGIYYNLDNNKKALEYWQKSRGQAKQRGDEKTLARTMNNIGLVYMNINKPDTAEKYFNTALELSIKTGFGILQSIATNNLSEVYRTKKNFNKAIEFVNKALEIDKRMLSLERQGNDYGSLANIYYDMGDYQKAIINARKAEELITKTSSLIKHRGMLEITYRIYEKLNKPYEALKYFKRYVNINDSIGKVEKINEINQQELKMRIHEKESEAAFEIKKKEAIAESELRNERLKLYAMIGGIILMLIIVFSIYKQMQTRKKAYEQLQHTQQLLSQQDKLASLGQLTAGIAHEIQNPLNFVNNFSELNSELISDLKSANDEKEKAELISQLEHNMHKIQTHGKRADGIVKSMLQHSRKDDQVKTNEDINKICDEALELALYGIRSVNQDFKVKIFKNYNSALPHIALIAHDINRVFLNIISNAFYAMNKKANILTDYHAELKITTVKKDNNIAIIFRDNGPGMSKKTADKIFEPFYTTKPAGDGTGLGLSISYDIIKVHGGDIKINAAENDYAEFVVTLPV